MKNNTRWFIVCLIAGVAATAFTAWAEDQFPPAWRSHSGSIYQATYQNWGFDTTNRPSTNATATYFPIAPEVSENAFGTNYALDFISSSFGKLWSDYQPSKYGEKQGVWDVGRTNQAPVAFGNRGTMAFIVANRPDAAPTAYKYVAVQVTHGKGATAYPGWPFVTLPGATLVTTNTWDTGVDAPTGVPVWRWWVYQAVYRLPVSPPSETILLHGTNGLVVDQVVVDTLTLDIPCPTDIVADSDPGTSSKVNVQYGPLPPVDNVITNITCVPPNGSTFNVGTWPVVCSLVDAYGQAKECNFTVTINQSIPPLAITQCAASRILALGAACQGSIPPMTSEVVTDPLGATVTQSPTAGTMVGAGPHEVVFTATLDAATVYCTNVVTFTGAPPAATNDTLGVIVNVAQTIPLDRLLLNDASPDGRAMSVVGVTAPLHGTAIMGGGSVVYTPATDYTGPDAFDYTNRDCAGLESVATVVVTVTAPVSALNLYRTNIVEVEPGVIVMTITGQGIPGREYGLLRGPDADGPFILAEPEWGENVKTASTVAPKGQLIYRRTNDPSPSIYRTKSPPPAP